METTKMMTHTKNNASASSSSILNLKGATTPDQASANAAQEDIYYRPPSEADSFLVQVMKGCPHNKCTFCGMFKNQKCHVLPTEEVLQGMDKDAEELGPKLLPLFTSLYLEGGDPLALQIDSLLQILEHAHKRFPALERVACYATAHFLCRKSQSEINALAEAGLRRVYVGMESGNDAILRSTNKGCTRADLLKAGEMLRHAGIENDVSIMLGIGGKDLSVPHAMDTGTLISNMEPICVRIRTFLPVEGTVLGDACAKGQFNLPEPHDVLRELDLMVREITGHTTLLSEHWTNFLTFVATMPDDKDRLRRFIAEGLRQPRGAFRPTGVSSVVV